MTFDIDFGKETRTMDVKFDEPKHNDVGFGEIQTIGGGGQNGATFIPSVSEEGVLSWTNDRELPNPEPVNIMGKDGRDGIDGIDGKDGYTPVKGKDYFDGKDGQDGIDGYSPIKGIDYFDGKPGKDGNPGKDGADGKTPVKGVDYFTAADKAEIVAQTIAALPVYSGEVASV